MNKTFLCLGATVLVGLVAAGHTLAATTDATPTATPHKPKKIDKMERRTDRRIAKDEASGRLSASEATALKQRQTQIENERSLVVTQSHGHLTRGEARHLKHEERDLNRQLKRDLKS